MAGVITLPCSDSVTRKPHPCTLQVSGLIGFLNSPSPLPLESCVSGDKISEIWNGTNINTCHSRYGQVFCEIPAYFYKTLLVPDGDTTQKNIKEQLTM